MTTPYTNMHRLLGEQLDELLALVWEVDEQLQPAVAEFEEPSHQPTVPFARLISAARFLHRQHTVDAKAAVASAPGEDDSCGARQSNPCSVHAALSFYLVQPDEIVLSKI